MIMHSIRADLDVMSSSLSLSLSALYTVGNVYVLLSRACAISERHGFDSHWNISEAMKITRGNKCWNLY